MHTHIDSLANWVDFEKELAFAAKFNITRVSITLKDGDWNLVAAGVRKKRRVVVFVRCHSITACLEMLLELATHDQLTYYDDKYASGWKKK